MVATGKSLRLLKIVALTGLTVLVAGLFLFDPWPAGVNAQELDFGENGGSTSSSGQLF